MFKRSISIILTCIISFFLPQIAGEAGSGPQLFYRSLVRAVAPVFTYNEEILAEETLLAEEAEFENLRAARGNEPETAPDGEEDQGEGERSANGADTSQTAGEGASSPNGTDVAAAPSADVGTGEETEDKTAAGDADSSSQAVPEIQMDFEELIQKYYIVDSSTTISSDDLDAEELLAKNLSVDKSSDGPQILIYHTHSQEGYQDSKEGDAETSVVALGEILAEILTEQYGFRVLHHTGEYDVDDRDHAYSNAAPVISEILAENPSIEVVIDLHRDSVPEENHLVTTIDGKQTAKIMFFNGLCRTTAAGDLTSMQNPYLKDNLAFSLQMQLAASRLYPDLTRKIYLKGYRYNMHFCPKSLLVEVGAQNNTFEEAKNAMIPLAALLAEVLQ